MCNLVSSLVKIEDCRTWLQTPLSRQKQALREENTTWMKHARYDCSTQWYLFVTLAFLSDRLIDLGTIGRDEGICLIETADTQIQTPTRYAALSYCWGTKEQAAQQLTTTSTRLRQHIKAILLDDMTTVMQNMVRFARALYIRYIWIDALCIMQDDPQDWMRESERMGLVYIHAFLTICTLTTISYLEAFLYRPPPVTVAFRPSLQPIIGGTFSLRRQPLRNRFRYPWNSIRLDRNSSAWASPRLNVPRRTAIATKDPVWLFANLHMRREKKSDGARRHYGMQRL
jgi:hypothetical protein